MSTKKHREWLKERRVQIFIDPEVREQLKALSDELGVSASQLYQYFVMCGMNNVSAAIKVLPKYLEKSDAPMWQYRINFERLKKDLGS